MAPPVLPYLADELVGEVLVRLPPAEPAEILQASLVCKRWRRLLSDPAFRRRYCEFHCPPPLLGFFHDLYDRGPIPRFFPVVASPCSPPELDCLSWWALDCRHGRVLIHSFSPTDLVVWDPITREIQRLPVPPYPHTYYTGAVLCAVDGCAHLDCHGGPFRVVYVGTDDNQDAFATWASVYSSETGEWGSPSSTIELESSYIEAWPSLCIGDTLYFMLDLAKSILRYDLAGHALSVVDVPEEYEEMRCEERGSVVMMEDGGLGFAGVKDCRLYLWAWQKAGAEATEAVWKQCKVIELSTLLPIPETPASLGVVGFVEGTDTIFLSTNVGMFTLKTKSEQVTKVCKEAANFAVIPYAGFYTP